MWVLLVGRNEQNLPLDVSCAAEEELETSDQTRWGELPMPSLQHVPLDTLSTGVSKLGNTAQSVVYITVHAMHST